MVREIHVEQALQVLRNSDPLAYRDPMGFLSRGSSRQEQVTAFQCESGEAIAVYRKPVNLESEVYLIGERPNELIELLTFLPEEAYLYLTQRETVVVNHLNASLAVQLVDTRKNLHCGVNELVELPQQDEYRAVRLGKEHKDQLRTQDLEGDPRGRWAYKQWVKYFGSNVALFGVLSEDKVVSFCAMAPSGEVALVYTVPSHRRKGLGRLSLLAATRFVIDQGCLAYYSVADENLASIRTAAKVGYVEHAKQYCYKVSATGTSATLGR